MKKAIRVTILTIGVIMGLGGIEHGVGEIFQGNVAPGGVVFPSWPDSPFFSSLAGEPAMSLIPNMLISGILSILFSLISLTWLILFVHREKGGLGLILISVFMLLVGAGFGPPLLGIILGTVAVIVHALSHRQRKLRPARLWRLLAGLWGWSYGACVTAWLMLCPGTAILAYFFAVDNPVLTSTLIFASFGLLLLTFITGYARDNQRTAAAHPSMLQMTSEPA